MKIDFYYWGALCPLNQDMLRLLQEYRHRLTISLHEISDQPQLARELGMYYPTLTVADDAFRYFSPLRRAWLEAFCRGEHPVDRPDDPRLGVQEACGEIVPLTAENYHLAARCTGKEAPCGCGEKIRFLQARGLSPFGFLNLAGNQLLGGVEYVPSLWVPYDIPHREETAFLTCVYLSDATHDYKSAPLRALETHLTGHYQEIVAISDETGAFPNGDLAFFLRNGYQDRGVVAREPGYCTLHLVGKSLPQP